MKRLAPLLLAALAGSAHGNPDMKGVALGLYATSGDMDYSPLLGEIVDVGADHVSLVVSWHQHDVRSSKLAPSSTSTVPDERIRKVIRAAHDKHLKVFLFPIVDIEVRRPLEWRGTLAPEDIDQWWASYERFILHYAGLAQSENVELYAVGSELVSTEVWRDRWLHLIRGVRKAYPGKVLYSANWDHYEQVSFWDQVDFMGVTAYNELSRDNEASEKDLTAAWAAVRASLTTFAKKIDRPLVITEVGYPSQDGAAVHPWDYTSRARIDLEEQRRCYAAFVSAWQGEGALEGVYFWNWWGTGGDKDGSYTPKGKPAEGVLRRWYKGLK